MLSLVDEAIRQVDTALVWLEATQERRRYNWHREEDAVLRRQWGRIPRPELAERVSAVLRRVTGDNQAERSVDGCFNRACELGLKAFQGDPGEMSLTRAAQLSGVPYHVVSQAYEDGALAAVRKGKQVYVSDSAWALWLAAYRERQIAQGEILNALEGTELLTKQEAMQLTRLRETHFARYLKTGVIEAWLLPGIRAGRGEWLVSRESAEALVKARAEGRLRTLLDSCPAYVALRKQLTADIRALRRAGRLERRDPLTRPGSLYHEGCFTVKQVASHVGVSAQVVYEAIARGEIKAESVVAGGRARYAVRPEEAQRYAERVREIPDTARRRDTFYLRQIKAAGLVTVRELAKIMNYQTSPGSLPADTPHPARLAGARRLQSAPRCAAQAANISL